MKGDIVVEIAGSFHIDFLTLGSHNSKDHFCRDILIQFSVIFLGFVFWILGLLQLIVPPLVTRWRCQWLRGVARPALIALAIIWAALAAHGRRCERDALDNT